MSVPVLTFFNNKGGVGKTSLVFHLAWMLSEMGKRVVAIDLDPQANLTSAFLSEDDLEVLWNPDDTSQRNTTIYQCVRPLTEVGDILSPKTKTITQRLHLVPGDLGLAGFEDLLSQEWTNALGSSTLYRPFRILSSFWQVAQMAAQEHNADIILADVGPTLGAINRSALIGTDYVVIPLAADLFSLQGLGTLGSTLRDWRAGWKKALKNWENPSFDLPSGDMRPLGYVLAQHSGRIPDRSSSKWADRVPAAYRELILGQQNPSQSGDCLARLKHYRSLAPMAQEVRKPIFNLTAADGAIGAHSTAAREAGWDFRELAKAILSRIDVMELSG